MLTSESAPGLSAAWATRDLEGSHSARGRGLVALLVVRGTLTSAGPGMPATHGIEDVPFCSETWADNRLRAVTSCLCGPEDLTNSLRAVTGDWWLARVQIVTGGSVLAAPGTVLGLRP